MLIWQRTTCKGGLPRENEINDYEKWCDQLGGVYSDHTIGTRTGYALFWCTGYDDPGNWYWCGYYGNDWYNQSLSDHAHGTFNDFITSITCTR